MKNKTLTKWELLLIIPLVVLFVCNNYFQGINNLTMLMISTLLLFGLVYDILNIYSPFQYVYLLLLFLIVLIFRWNRTTISIVMLGLLFMMIPPENTIHMYGWIMGLQTFIGIFLAIMGIAPMKDARTGVLTLGFGNENTLGAVLETIAFAMVFERKKGKFLVSKSLYRWFFFFIVILLNLLILHDNTVVFTMLLFLIFLKSGKFISQIKSIQILIIILPIIISLFSIWLGINYNPNTKWMNILNNFVTQRAYIWHYYLSNYPVLWMPSKWILNKLVFWGFFDGSYVYFVITEGILLTILLVIGLILCNAKLIKSKKFSILAIMLALEIAGFSENIIITYYWSFPLIFVVSAYNPTWLYNNKSKKVGDF